MKEIEVSAEDVRRERTHEAAPVLHGLYLAAVVGGASLIMLLLLALFQAA
jgi:hypothetical protein